VSAEGWLKFTRTGQRIRLTNGTGEAGWQPTTSRHTERNVAADSPHRRHWNGWLGIHLPPCRPMPENRAPRYGFGQGT